MSWEHKGKLETGDACLVVIIIQILIFLDEIPNAVTLER